MEMVAAAGVAATHTWNSLALSNMEAMRLLQRFGLLRGANETREKRAWGKLKGKERSFRNIAEHCLVVGMIANVLLRKLVERGYLTRELYRRGVKAAILHDLTKRQELQGLCGEEENENPQLVNQEELLVRYGLSENDLHDFSLARLAGGNTYRFNLADVNPRKSQEEVVAWSIFFADHFAAHTSIVSFRERVDELTRRAEYSKELEQLHVFLYGEDSVCGLTPKEIAQGVYEHVFQIYSRVESVFREMLGLNEEAELSEFVKSEIKQCITSGQK